VLLTVLAECWIGCGEWFARARQQPRIHAVVSDPAMRLLARGVLLVVIGFAIADLLSDITMLS
jgi:hypothetical protein